jgi:predicted nuclease with TOPRIM domain
MSEAPPPPPLAPLGTVDVQEETRIAVADLITINRKLRRAVKEREAERSSMRGETEKLKKELANMTEFSQQQAEDIIALQQRLKVAEQVAKSNPQSLGSIDGLEWEHAPPQHKL